MQSSTIYADIRKAHEKDIESALDTTPADELIKEVRKAMQSTGDRVQEFLEIFCKAFRLKYKRLTDEERTTLKRLFKRSPLIKNSGAQTVEMKAAVAGVTPATASSKGNINFDRKVN